MELVKIGMLFCTGLYVLWCLYNLVFKKPVIYIDEGNSKVFYSKKYGISAKPDSIADRHTIEEKKSRARGIYDSDRAQMIATALAVRSKYPITKGYLVTATSRHYIDLSGTDKELFEMIRSEYDSAMLIKKGKVPPPSPSFGKCKSCQFNKECKYKAA